MLSRYFQKSCTLNKPPVAVVEHLSLAYIDEETSAKFKGPIQASFSEDIGNPLPKAWVETFGELGYPVSGDPFSGEAVGGYINAMNIHPTTKQRSHSGSAYYEPVQSRKNLQVITSASVEKLVLGRQDGQIVAQGVSYVKDGQTQTVLAAKEVILAAGVFNTPKLLELSGIGSASLLESLNIPVYIDNENVGENCKIIQTPDLVSRSTMASKPSMIWPDRTWLLSVQLWKTMQRIRAVRLRLVATSLAVSYPWSTFSLQMGRMT